MLKTQETLFDVEVQIIIRVSLLENESAMLWGEMLETLQTCVCVFVQYIFNEA